MARPTNYDEAIATRILDAIADGELLTQICKRRGMPKRPTVTSWISRNYNDFGDRYWQARASQAIIWSEQVLEILDDAKEEDSMARAQIARSRSDARKWMLSRMIPSRFSERLQVDHGGHRAEVHIWLPGKENSGDRAHVIEGQAQELEDGADEPAD
jgi:hypothetical protein